MAGGDPGDSDASGLLERCRDRDNCDLTTFGRRTGQSHTVEIWFAVHDGSLFLIGDPSLPDWYRNVAAGAAGGREARVRVVLDGVHLVGSASPILDPDRRHLAGLLLATKYRRWLTSDDLDDDPSSWAYGGAAIEISGLELRD